MNKLTAAYVAGLIDGEGYIALEHHKGTGAALYRPTVKVAMCNEGIIRWLSASFGGHVDIRHAKQKNHRDSFCWIYTGRKIEPFLRKIRPFLKLKQRQCDILIQRISLSQKMGNGTGSAPGWNIRYSPETVQTMRELYEEIRSLNKRGTAA